MLASLMVVSQVDTAPLQAEMKSYLAQYVSSKLQTGT
jgi:hypothetical protein